MSHSRKSAINLVLGAANIGDKSIDAMARFDAPDEVRSFLDVFARRGYNQIDTSRMYSPHAPGSCEPRLAAVSAGERFVIDTKVMSWKPATHAKNEVLSEINLSLETLRIPQINIEYLHVPDRDTPFEEPSEEVQRFVDICEEYGYVKPSVYQGQYNAVVRSGEKDLFPILRKNGIAFYAYSPAAGGLFAGNHKNAKAGGRWDRSISSGEVYANLYLRPSIMAATEKALETASRHGIAGHAVALRWTAHHSLLSSKNGDSIIIGASSVNQLESNIDMIEQGPLPHDVVAAIEAVYEEIGDEIPYHF
ncbi:Oxidoreductase sirO [Colletotrichum siamense]|nr:Oxidoreductase sirO [Colletotrichum siamense]